ncbi:MAG: DUF1801 domain-containing protein [Cyclobacteriaceae bacterium]
MKSSVEVDLFLEKSTQWKPELQLLRTIALACGLTEVIKWKVPCFTYESKNIALIHGFKGYCAISFFKGTLLKDDKKILTQQTENVQSGRLVKFEHVDEIMRLKTTLQAYIKEAIEVENAGLKIDYKKADAFDIPEELAEKFITDVDFKMAFYKLTPGRQKGYLLYFSAPKQSKTKTARIAQYQQRILNGKGIRDCICGLSLKMPNCDGSHKNASMT